MKNINGRARSASPLDRDTSSDRLAPCVYEVDELREVFDQLPGVRKCWTHQGSLYVPVERRRLGEFAESINCSKLQLVKSDKGSVVYRTECLLDYWRNRKIAVENRQSPVVRTALKRQKKQLRSCIGWLPTGESSAKDRMIDGLGRMMSDDEREQLEDELDNFNPRDLSDPHWRYYGEDSVQTDSMEAHRKWKHDRAPRGVFDCCSDSPEKVDLHTG